MNSTPHHFVVHDDSHLMVHIDQTTINQHHHGHDNTLHHPCGVVMDPRIPNGHHDMLRASSCHEKSFHPPKATTTLNTSSKKRERREYSEVVRVDSFHVDHSQNDLTTHSKPKKRKDVLITNSKRVVSGSPRLPDMVVASSPMTTITSGTRATINWTCIRFHHPPPPPPPPPKNRCFSTISPNGSSNPTTTFIFQPFDFKGERKVIRKRTSSSITKEEMLSVLHLSQHQACQVLGCSLSTVKRRFYDLKNEIGLCKWPKDYFTLIDTKLFAKIYPLSLQSIHIE
nr:unnamed protein product [Naegleria fowleri]